jgi:methyl-accepting chemotaxis protein
MNEDSKGKLTWIEQTLATPGLEDTKHGRAFAVNVIALGGLALSLLINGVILVQGMFSTKEHMTLSIVLLVSSTLWFTTAYWLCRQGKVNAASHILMWGGVAVVLAGSIPDPGSDPTDPVWYLFTLTVVGASLLLSTRWSFAFAVIDTLLYLVSPLIKQLYLPGVPSPTPYQSAMMGGMLLILATFTWLFRSGLEKALHRSQRQASELEHYQHTLEQRMAAEREQRKHLQDTVETYVIYMAEIAQGRLDVRLPIDGNGHQTDDPLTALGHNLNDTVASLQRMTLEIHDVSGSLNAAAAEILAVTTQQASGANEQSAAISQTTTTVDEVKTIAEQAVARAQEVAGTAQRTVQVSHAGQQAVYETIKSMREIKARVESIAENILALSEQTQQIGEIIATVNDIAAQSNMLALNASVEAARAGEYGKGFAVVAVEVRNLAEQSRQATAQVKAILSDIQKATNATVMATEEGTKGVEEGVQLAAQTQEVIEQLAGVIEEATQAAMQMVAGGRQQATGMEQIAVAMQNINHATAQSLASTHQAEKTARDLSELARSLTEAVDFYQL